MRLSAAVLLLFLSAQWELSASDHPGDSPCHYALGDWVRDETRPLYDYKACAARYLDGWGACKSKKNQDFPHWRWKPSGCDLPKLTVDYLKQKLKGLKLLMVGDSLMRNHFKSMLCLFSERLNGTGGLTVHFRMERHPVDKALGFINYLKIPELGTDIQNVASTHFCVNTHKPDADGQGTDCTRPDPSWHSLLGNFSVGIFTTSHWWGSTRGFFHHYQKNESAHINYTSELHNTDSSNWVPIKERIASGELQVGKHVADNLLCKDGESCGHQQALDLLVNHTQDFKGRLFYQTTSPSHFWGGDSMNGTCNHFMRPWRSRNARWADNHFPFYIREVDTFRPLWPKWEILDITHMSKLRPDAHRSVALLDTTPNTEHKEDCGHWCLGGTTDAWLEVFLAQL